MDFLPTLTPGNATLKMVLHDREAFIDNMAQLLLRKQGTPGAFAMACDFMRLAAISLDDVAERLSLSPRTLEIILRLEKETAEAHAIKLDFVAAIIAILREGAPYRVRTLNVETA